jgi:ATP-dependent RNA helicase DDX24/MAK5
LQRLLEEQEKAMRLSREDESTQDENSRESPLRALILTPTRELAKQVLTLEFAFSLVTKRG